MSYRIRILITFLCLSAVLFLNRGIVLSTIYGYPYGIKSIERSKYGIPEINWKWDRYPVDNKKSATQIWLNNDGGIRRYAKKTFMNKGLLHEIYEEDRYILQNEKERQLDLVFEWHFEENILKERSARVEWVNKIDLEGNCYDWFEDSEILHQLPIQEADDLRNQIDDDNYRENAVLAIITNANDRLPMNINLVAKLIVVDGSIGDNLHYCSEEIKPFSVMDKYDCSFIIDSIEYNVIEKYVFDGQGGIEEYWHYKSEGPLVHSYDNLLDDQKLFEYIGGKDMRLEVVSGKIIDTEEETVNIGRVLKKQRLIFARDVDFSNRIGNRVIYQYEEK